jgi:hypothetical protein
MAKRPKHLTRAELEKIVDGMSARDVFNATPDQSQDVGKIKGTETASRMFELAAERQGFGADALDRVSVGDAIHLANLLSESLNVGGPKAEDIEALPISDDTGDSDQS